MGLLCERSPLGEIKEKEKEKKKGERGGAMGPRPMRGAPSPPLGRPPLPVKGLVPHC